MATLAEELAAVVGPAHVLTDPDVTASYADGVAPGNLAVAASGGQEEKVSFLYFDVFSLPEGAVVDSTEVPREQEHDSGNREDDGQPEDAPHPARQCCIIIATALFPAAPPHF